MCHTPLKGLSITSFLGTKHKQPGEEADNSHQIPGSSTRIHHQPTLCLIELLGTEENLLICDVTLRWLCYL